MSNGEMVLQGITKSYQGKTAVNNVNLRVKAGEFFSILGPSGCGKSTILKMIGGFIPPSSGRVFIDGRDMTALPPNRRAVNTVFQNYALFPFLSVRDNVAFGLRRARVKKRELTRRVDEVLELVELAEYGKRRTHELSGGQQQRVALARALVLRPDVLLLDEPLSALDAKMRRQLQEELKSLHREVGTTFVYITHDQDEALTMSDRIAVLREGQLEQVGSPFDIYERPQTKFVAEFMGVSSVLHATVQGRSSSNSWIARVGTSDIVVSGERPSDDEVALSIRPERVHLSASSYANALSGIVVDRAYIGPSTHYILELDDGIRLRAEIPNDGRHSSWSMGERVFAELSPDDVRVIGKETSIDDLQFTAPQNGSSAEPLAQSAVPAK